MFEGGDGVNDTIVTTTIEKELRDKDELMYTFRGTSMLPFLRQGKDLVIVHRIIERPKRFDAVLYRVGKRLILHRIIKVEDGSFTIRGDNCIAREHVRDDQLLGVLTAFVRTGRTHSRTVSADSSIYRLLVWVWYGIYPLRYLYRRARRLAGALWRRLKRRANKNDPAR